MPIGCRSTTERHRSRLAMDVYDLIVLGAPPLRSKLPDAPAELEAVLLRCLQKEPAQRYPDVGELAAALAGFGPPERRIAAERARRILQVQPRARTASSPRADVVRKGPMARLYSADRTPSTLHTGVHFGFCAPL